ncbi:hypothetical protein D5S17_06005 [Pseudonocardiaceae bacterium YIM PH 21723]|nr:hypothetical protein D5S17_06005 [Pseudonocardiaceae bacterium YIM PH 21723]
MRVYVPATVAILRKLVDDGLLDPAGRTAFALTPMLRESYATGDAEELEYAAMLEAARASLRLLSAELDAEEKLDEKAVRRAVIAVDVEVATPRPDLDDAVVKLSAPFQFSEVAAVHLDTEEAIQAVRTAAGVIDAADMGDPDAEFLLGDAEDHELAWYAPQELPFVLDLL